MNEAAPGRPEGKNDRERAHTRTRDQGYTRKTREGGRADELTLGCFETEHEETGVVTDDRGFATCFRLRDRDFQPMCRTRQDGAGRIQDDFFVRGATENLE